jgi:hypothetical protein
VNHSTLLDFYLWVGLALGEAKTSNEPSFCFLRRGHDKRAIELQTKFTLRRSSVSAGLWTTVHNCTAACADSEQGIRIRKAKAGSWTMEIKNAVSSGPAIEAQIAEIDGMTLEAVRRLLFDCMTALPEGRINAQQGEALTRAAENRIRAIRKEHMAVARQVSELAKRQTQRMQWIVEAPIICDAYEASLAPS